MHPTLPAFVRPLLPAASVLLLALGFASDAHADEYVEIFPDELGTGIDLRYEPGVARDTCMDGEIDVNPSFVIDFEIQEFRSTADLKARLSQYASAEMTSKLEASGRLDYSAEFMQSVGVTVFSFHVETVERYFQLLDDDDTNGSCDESVPDDTEGFLDQCGTAYLHSEVLGGEVLVLAVGSNIKAETGIEGEAKGEAPLTDDISVSGGTVGELLARLDANAIDASVYVDGLPPLAYGSTEDGLLTVESDQLSSYLSDLYQSVQKALVQGNPDRAERLTVYGQPRSQALNPNRALMASCAVDLPDHVHAGLGCVDDLKTGVIEASKPESSKAGSKNLQVDLIQAKIEEGARWIWGDDPEGNQARQMAVAQHIEFCKTEVYPQVLDTCQESAFYDLFVDLNPPGESGEPTSVATPRERSAVCATCVFPDDLYTLEDGTEAGCAPDQIAALIKGVDEARYYAPGLPELSYTSVDQDMPTVDIAQREDNVCALAGMSGRFAGAGESVRLSPGTSDWRLTVASQRTEANEHLRAESVCVQRSAFVDASGSPTWVDESSYDATSAKGVLPGPEHVSVLGGLQGKLDDASDGGQVLQGDPSEVRDLGSTYRAFGYGLGVTSPSNQTARYQTYAVSANAEPDQKVVRESLARTADAFCMLTGVTGDFDGDAEVVRLSHDSVRWTLEVQAACTDHDGFFGGDCIARKPVTATALCYDYAQD